MAHRTQLYLDESRYSYVVSLARQHKTSIAQIIRNLIDQYRQQTTAQKFKDDPIYKMIGLYKGGKKPVSVAEHYETYLYGTESQIKELEAEHHKKNRPSS